MSEMLQHRFIKELLGALVGLAVISIALNKIATAAEPGESKTKGGLTVYLGVVPAEIVKGPSSHSSDRAMHGRIPRGPHEYHVVAALFDTASGARVSDAAVTAQISGLGLSGNSKKLEPMEIAGSTTYGAFFNLPGRDLYTVKLTIDRSSSPRPLTFNFKYEHR
jgi:hypothetical protein